MWSSNFTSGYLSKGNENTNLKRHLQPHAHCSVIYNSQDVETTYVFMEGRVDKENVLYTHVRWLHCNNNNNSNCILNAHLWQLKPCELGLLFLILQIGKWGVRGLRGLPWVIVKGRPRSSGSSFLHCRQMGPFLNDDSEEGNLEVPLGTKWQLQSTRQGDYRKVATLCAHHCEQSQDPEQGVPLIVRAVTLY